MKKVILINKNDKAIGESEIYEAHIKAKLHRAFSILLFNKKGETMLQKRSEYKPIAPYLWSNTCCSHPRLGKNIQKEAEQRLKYEMGITCSLKKKFNFYYKIRYGYFTEHEVDHIFIGQFNGKPVLNKKEALSWKWVSPKDIRKDIKSNPEKYTHWLKMILDKLQSKHIC